jgi:hypothetical protein
MFDTLLNDGKRTDRLGDSKNIDRENPCWRESPAITSRKKRNLSMELNL